FNADGASTVEEAEQRRKDAIREANAMAALARKGDELTVDQVRHMRSVLARHEGDPLFNEKFATSLGAKGTLQFWVDLSDAHAGARGAERVTLKSFQSQLSMNLANATPSDSRGMQQW